MTRSWMIAASLCATMASAGAAVLPQGRAEAKPAARTNWTAIVVATPEGGFRMGNPAAPINLVEYASLTCPHCAHFDEEGVPKLIQNHVASGKVSYELRNFVRDPFDLAAALVSRCANVRSYFPLTRQLFATLEQWTGRFSALSASEYDSLEAMAPMPKLARIANIAGFEAVAAKFGVPSNRLKACLSDEKAVQRLTEMRKVAVERFELEGTPTFIINGKRVAGVSTWVALEPMLKQSGG